MIFLSDHMVKDKSHDMIRLSDAMDPEQGVLPIRTGMAPGLDKDTKERPRKQDVSGGMDGIGPRSALAELRRAAGGFEAVLEQNRLRKSLILLGFRALGHPVSPSVN